MKFACSLVLLVCSFAMAGFTHWLNHTLITPLPWADLASGVILGLGVVFSLVLVKCS